MFPAVVAVLKNTGSLAELPKRGSGMTKRTHTPTKWAMLDLAETKLRQDKTDDIPSVKLAEN